jgi:hypothetical protein
LGDNRLVAGGRGVSGVQGSDASSNWGSCVTITFTVAVRTIVSDCRRTVTQRTRAERMTFDGQRLTLLFTIHRRRELHGRRARNGGGLRRSAIHAIVVLSSTGESASSDMSAQPPTRRSSAVSSLSPRGLYRREKRARNGDKCRAMCQTIGRPVRTGASRYYPLSRL